MQQDVRTRNRAAVARMRQAQYDYEPERVRTSLQQLFAQQAVVHLATPFEDLDGAAGLYGEAYAPLHTALPDLERRDWIVVAGPSASGDDWVGCCGCYTGTFQRPWLDIPPTGHQIAMRFHEFYRFEDGRVVEMQALWDIPELMLQARAWPMAPALGREWQVPAPATQDGLIERAWDADASLASRQLVLDMLIGLSRHATGGVAAMELERYWHPRCNWYGPSGIGTGRGIAGFRKWHQIPFLRGMPDRRGASSSGRDDLFADGHYVAVTGWPNMQATITGDGWMGIAPAGQQITMRSLDFWRCENGLLRENWVLVDLLHVYRQIGVDVLARMREFTPSRAP
ncbi:MAG: ester cyclase [Rhodoferax sp.]|jgi:predicted ester cyclase|nr:ester cyclase [Rhodoferax sp.]